MVRRSTYVVVWVLLVAATLLEVYTRSLPAGAALIVAAIILISASKASLIALYYMHLRYDSKWISLFPLLGLAAIALEIATSILGGGIH